MKKIFIQILIIICPAVLMLLSAFLQYEVKMVSESRFIMYPRFIVDVILGVLAAIYIILVTKISSSSKYKNIRIMALIGIGLAGLLIYCGGFLAVNAVLYSEFHTLLFIGAICITGNIQLLK